MKAPKQARPARGADSDLARAQARCGPALQSAPCYSFPFLLFLEATLFCSAPPAEACRKRSGM